MSRRLGLIIGINQYQDTTFRPLQFAENDARALAQWLVNTRGGQWSPGDVQFVYGAHATRELVEPLISQTCIQMAEPGDLVLIYFAGHAYIDERRGEGYLALANTHYAESGSGLHLISFAHHILAHTRATNIILMLDCYQTGLLWSEQRTTPFDATPLLGTKLLNKLQHQNNHLFLCSCRGNEMMPETGERSLGTFAHTMIVGLCGPAGDGTADYISLQQLHTYLYNTLGEQHRPRIFGKVPNPIVLIGNAPAQPPAPQGIAPSLTLGTHMSHGTANNGLLMGQAMQHATATAQQPPQPLPQQPLQPSQSAPDISPSGKHLASHVEQHRQQQTTQMLNQARQLLQMQQGPEALNMVEQILQIVPNDISALTLKGQILGTLGRLQEALAVVEQLIQLSPRNPLVWSMQAVLLSNVGQYPAALAAIERSLELNASDPETYAIKTNIMASMAETQSKGGNQKQRASFTPENTSEKQSGGVLSFFIGATIQVIGFIMGTVGMILPILQPTLPVTIAFSMASLGMALLCVNAARGAYRYGFVRLLFTAFMCVVAAGTLGGTYQFGYTLLIGRVQANPQLIVPVLFFVLWLAAAAVVPFFLACGGFISGLIARARKA